MSRRKSNTTTHVSPKSIAAGDAVLGSILVHGPCLAEVSLIPEDFGFDWQQLVFRVLVKMSQAHEQIDVVTVAERLQEMAPAEEVDTPEGTSWLLLLTTLVRETPTWRNIASYAKIVKEQAVARRAAHIAASLAENVHGDLDQIDAATRELMALRGTDRKYSMRIGEAIPKAIDDLDARCEGKKPTGIPTGYTKLDLHIGGLAPQCLYVIGARPGMGKTTIGLDILLNNPTVASGFMSTEMPTSQLVDRACATVSGVSAHAIRLGKVNDQDWPALTDAYGKIEKMPLYINEKPAPTAEEVIRQARHWSHEHSIRLLVIDYIQRIKSADERRDRHQELQRATVAFKELARDLNIPVVLLAQINRQVESRADKRPTLADFKDTGALEEEGDVVISLFRNEVYEPKNIDTKGIIEIHVLKNRHGPCAWLKARYNAACLRIENIDPTGDDFN